MRKPMNRSWQPNQDTLLQFLVQSSAKKRIPWLQLSKQLSLQTGRERTGKQCRERWLHQLNPGITKQKWGSDETKILFQLHRKLGNRWSAIAEQLQGRTDNIVKNYFYSMVRRTITKINSILTQKKYNIALKQMRPFGSDLASKLILVSDGHYQLRVKLNDISLEESAKNILNQIIDLRQRIDSNTVDQDQIQSLLVKMHEFRSNSKKRKRTHKSKQNKRFSIQVSQFQQQHNKSTDSSKFDDISQLNEQLQSFAIHRDQSCSQYLKYSSKQIFTQNLENDGNKAKNILDFQQKCLKPEPQIHQLIQQESICSSSITCKILKEQNNEKQQSPIPTIPDLQQRMETNFTCIFTPIQQDDWQFPEQVAQDFAYPFCRYASFIGLQASGLGLQPISDNLLP